MSLTLIETTSISDPNSPEARDMIFNSLMEHAGKNKFDNSRIVLMSNGQNGSVVTDIQMDFNARTLTTETIRSKLENGEVSGATDTLYHRLNNLVDEQLNDLREGTLSPNFTTVENEDD